MANPRNFHNARLLVDFCKQIGLNDYSRSQECPAKIEALEESLALQASTIDQTHSCQNTVLSTESVQIAASLSSLVLRIVNPDVVQRFSQDLWDFIQDLAELDNDSNDITGKYAVM